MKKIKLKWMRWTIQVMEILTNMMNQVDSILYLLFTQLETLRDKTTRCSMQSLNKTIRSCLILRIGVVIWIIFYKFNLIRRMELMMMRWISEINNLSFNNLSKKLYPINLPKFWGLKINKLICLKISKKWKMHWSF